MGKIIIMESVSLINFRVKSVSKHLHLSKKIKENWKTSTK